LTFKCAGPGFEQAVAKKTGSASLMGRAFAYERKGDKIHAEADRAAALKLDADEGAGKN
jgi:uncharacterized protein HemY